MSDLATALVTAASTALFAAVVFVIGQFVLRWLIEPLQEYRELRGEVAHALLYYANVVEGFTSPEDIQGARKHLRGLASKLHKTHAKVPLYNACARWHLVPRRQDLFEASTQLTGWSNAFRPGDDTGERRRTIARCLGIEEVY